MGLSVAVIIYNEEENINRFLNSVENIADEIIVVDSFSKDRSKELCLQHPKVKFFEKKFNGYGEQKNFALEQCTQEWIFFPDADEIPDETLRKSIDAVVSDKADFSVYKMKFKNYLGPFLIKYGGWGNVCRERLFRNKKAIYSDDKVHEFLITSEKSGILNGFIHHYTYRNIHHYFSKMNNYSDMMADKMFLKGKKSSQAKIVIGPLFEFFKLYIIKLGFLDGFIGFYIARAMAYYKFMKYVKLYSLARQKERELKEEQR